MVMVMVMVMGPKRQDWHRQGAQRWGHREQVRPRHPPLPIRRPSYWLSSTLRVL